MLTGQGGMFSVFLRYKNIWLKKPQVTDLDVHAFYLDTWQFGTIPKAINISFPSLESIGFEPTSIKPYLPTGITGTSERLSSS